eukprot:1082007-Karenia_brevis.AAC.1
MEIKKAVGLGLIPPLTDEERYPQRQPKPQDTRKIKSGSRNKNFQVRLRKLKICARLVAWLDSYIVE